MYDSAVFHLQSLHNFANNAAVLKSLVYVCMCVCQFSIKVDRVFFVCVHLIMAIGQPVRMFETPCTRLIRTIISTQRGEKPLDAYLLYIYRGSMYNMFMILYIHILIEYTYLWLYLEIQNRLWRTVVAGSPYG